MLNSFREGGFESKVNRQQHEMDRETEPNDQDHRSIAKNVDVEKNNKLRQKVNKGKQNRADWGT